jgi:hypothetical protein
MVVMGSDQARELELVELHREGKHDDYEDEVESNQERGPERDSSKEG